MIRSVNPAGSYAVRSGAIQQINLRLKLNLVLCIILDNLIEIGYHIVGSRVAS